MYIYITTYNHLQLLFSSTYNVLKILRSYTICCTNKNCFVHYYVTYMMAIYIERCDNLDDKIIEMINFIKIKDIFLFYRDDSKFLYITSKTNTLAFRSNYETSYCMHICNSIIIAL